MKAQNIKITDLHPNTGQVEGLPKNPRFIKDEKFQKLIKSLQDDPEMMQLREIIAYDNHGELVVICGNMRFRAAKELGLKEVPCKILPADTDVEKLKAYTIKDNVEFGQNDWETLANEWDTSLLENWGVDLPAYSEEVKLDDFFADGSEREANNDEKITVIIPEDMTDEKEAIRRAIEDVTKNYKGCKIK